MHDLKKLLTLAANALPMGAGAGVASGLLASYRHGYLQHGSTSLALQAIASDAAVTMAATAAVVFLVAALSMTLHPWMNPTRRWVAIAALLLLVALIFVNPFSVLSPQVARHFVTIAFLCAVALALLTTTGAPTDSRWARRLAAAPVAAALILALGLGGTVHLLHRRAASEPKPNVVLIVVDTLRADHLGTYGYHRSTSPRLDQLVRQSTLFTRAYTQAPWTSPSVAALMTSRYPGELGYESSRRPAVLQLRFQTLAEMLWEAGYETRAFVSHVFVARKLGFDQGFDRFSDEHGRGADYISSPAVIADATRYLDQAREPFFLFVHLFDPHFSYIEHPGHRFGIPYSGWMKSGMSIQELLRRKETFRSDDLAHLLSVYDSEISFTDEHIGLLLQALRARGLFDDSWIIVAADHGEAFLDRSDLWIGHGRTLYNELLRVPLIVKRPGQQESRTIDSPVGLVDVLPTLARSIGLEVPGGTAGVTLPLDAGDEVGHEPVRPVFAETKDRGRWLQAAILGDWKLIVDRETGDSELFDLRSDPGERKDLSSREVEMEQALMHALDSWDASLSRKERTGSEDAGFSSEELRNLKALGYLD